MARRSSVLTVFGVAMLVVVADQASKAWAVAQLRDQPPIEVLGRWLQWSFATNSGAAFSFGSGSTWLFTLLAAVIIGSVLYFTPKVANQWWALSMGLILGGGLGNFLDRLFREPSFGQGHVIDFIRVPNWPVFNIADMAVVSGACLAVLLSLRGIDYRGAQDDAPDTADAAATLR
jgi:signal peptidase II